MKTIISDKGGKLVIRNYESINQIIDKIEQEYNSGTPLLLAIQNHKPDIKKHQRQYLRQKLNVEYMVEFARANYEVVDLDGLIDLAKKNGILVYKLEHGKKVFL